MSRRLMAAAVIYVALVVVLWSGSQAPAAAKPGVPATPGNVIGFVKVGADPRSVVVSADGSTVIVANAGSRTISAIDAHSRNVDSETPVGGTPSGLAISADGALAYVSVSETGELAAVSVPNGVVTRRLMGYGQLHDVAVAASGQRLWAPSTAFAPEWPDGLGGTTSGALIQAFDYGSIGDAPAAATVAGVDPRTILGVPTLNRMFVANHGSESVSVFDGDRGTPVATIAVNQYPNRLAARPDGAEVFVLGELSREVLVIGTSTNTVIRRLPVSRAAVDLAVSPDGRRLYVATTGLNDPVWVLKADTGRPIGTLVFPSVDLVSPLPQRIAVSPDGSRLFVTDANLDRLWVGSTQRLGPGPVQHVQAKSGFKSAVVSWRPPTVMGTGESISYSVRSWPSGGTCVTTVASCIVDGLETGEAYEFEVIPQTKAGLGVSKDSNKITIG